MPNVPKSLPPKDYSRTASSKKSNLSGSSGDASATTPDVVSGSSGSACTSAQSDTSSKPRSGQKRTRQSSSSSDVSSEDSETAKRHKRISAGKYSVYPKYLDQHLAGSSNQPSNVQASSSSASSGGATDSNGRGRQLTRSPRISSRPSSPSVDIRTRTDSNGNVQPRVSVMPSNSIYNPGRTTDRAPSNSGSSRQPVRSDTRTLPIGDTVHNMLTRSDPEPIQMRTTNRSSSHNS